MNLQQSSVGFAIALSLFLLPASDCRRALAGPDSPDEEKDGKEKKEAGDGEDSGNKPKTKPMGPEESYVRDHLKEFLNPTDISFLKDGRVKLHFNFRQKKSEHEEIFTPKITNVLKSNLRWSIPREEYYLEYLPSSPTPPTGGASGSSSGTVTFSRGGLKIGDKGMTTLNCWFADDVEVEAVYQHTATYNKNQTIALTFTSEKKKGAGCNLGSQTMLYRNGQVAKSAGSPQEVTSHRINRFKLLVQGGVVEAYRDNRKSSSLPYDRKDMESGRLGIQWSSGASGIFNTLTITGKLDWIKTFEQIKKSRK